MAEYLAPGVYVEEFDSGVKAMEGVGTSTAGFIGYAQRGPVVGRPVFLSSYGDYQRRFGNALSKAEYAENCYLPYAVEAFFSNGGSGCYVMRCAPKDAICAEASTAPVKPDPKPPNESQTDGGKSKAKAVSLHDAPAFSITFKADNVGDWGNGLQLRFGRAMSTKSTAISVGSDKRSCVLKSTAGFAKGDIVRYTEKKTEQITEQIAGKTTMKMVETSVYHDFLVESVAGDTLTFTSVKEGVSIAPDIAAVPTKTFGVCTLNLTVLYGDLQEHYENISLNQESPSFIVSVLERSALVHATVKGKASALDLLVQLGAKADAESHTITLSGGNNGNTCETASSEVLLGNGDGDLDIAGKRKGLRAFTELGDVNILAIPGVTDANVQAALIAHCESHGDRFAILDAKRDEDDIAALVAYKDRFDSSYAALYHPWLKVYCTAERRDGLVPPSGAVAGIYARSDYQRGVHKAPANEVVRGATGVSCSYNDAEQSKLNPKSVNLIRAIPGSGIRVWGARTLSSDANWKYVNVRRLFLYIEKTIQQNTAWAVFEPNDAALWSRVKGTIQVFLTSLWRNGALMGTSANEAFFVNIGLGSTMTQDDVVGGRLICVIGVAPVRPAEFVIFRITQKMQDSQ